jgi:CubicO group peptidase (beta-lactamase class C family)
VEQGRFSGSVLIAKDGKTLLCKGYGMANYEHDVPNTPQTIFRIASLGKQFTAMAIMQLQEQGLLSVDDTLSKYIPDYPNGDKITIHHLLTHTSGIPKNSPNFKQEKIKSHTLETRIALFKDLPLDSQPGEKYNYTNSGYILLGYIIEKVSGKKYETVLKENIFAPLNMISSGYDKARFIIKNQASGYSIDGNGLINADYTDSSFRAGAGALYSTVEDLYLWDQALYSEKLLPKKSLATIFTAHVKQNKDNLNSSSYGYGWEIGKKNNRNVIEHSGEMDGFTADIKRYPDDGVCIIVLSNCDYLYVLQPNVTKITKGLAAIIFGEKYELPKKRIAVNPEIYDQYVGKYKFKEDFFLTVTKENNKLISQVTGQEKLEVYPESETEFFNNVMIDGKISFIKDETGKITKLILHQISWQSPDGKDMVAERIE